MEIIELDGIKYEIVTPVIRNNCRGCDLYYDKNRCNMVDCTYFTYKMVEL